MTSSETPITQISIQEGVQKQILHEGTGDIPPIGSKVKVHYTGTLASNGEKFDSSRDRNDPFEFSLGKGQVIKGWDSAVATMKVGERAILTLAPEMAYGSHGSPPSIPANATLIFDVELLDFEADPSEPSECWSYCQERKSKGNANIKEQPKKAIDEYSKALKKIDLCKSTVDAKELNALKGTLYLNSSVAFAALSNWKESEKNARAALKVLDSTSVKANFRLAFALGQQEKFEEALEVVEGFNGESSELEALKASILGMKQVSEQKRKELYSRMFK